MALRRLLRSSIPEETLAAVAEEVAARYGEPSSFSGSTMNVEMPS